MQTPRLLIIFGLLATVLTSVLLLPTVSAENKPMTDQQISRIRANCVSAKNTLTQLHASDALLRVNRGQMYESMTTKLMARFNSRVSSNHFDTKGLLSVTNNYGTALTTFRNDYQAYEERLSDALKIDCTKEPVAFYDSVASARTKRSQVHVDVLILHQYIDDYKAAFNTVASDLVSRKGGNN